MNKLTIDGFQRLNKVEALKQYSQGVPVYVTCDDLRPGAPWHPEVKLAFMQGNNVYNFDYQCDTVRVYGQTKKSLMYWIKEGDKK